MKITPERPQVRQSVHILQPTVLVKYGSENENKFYYYDKILARIENPLVKISKKINRTYI